MLLFYSIHTLFSLFCLISEDVKFTGKLEGTEFEGLKWDVLGNQKQDVESFNL